MANPKRPAGTFVSAHKKFLVRKDADWESYTVEPRNGAYKVTGCITKSDDVWRFYPSLNVVNLDHIELLDIAAAIKMIEKRENNPNLYQK